MGDADVSRTGVPADQQQQQHPREAPAGSAGLTVPAGLDSAFALFSAGTAAQVGAADASTSRRGRRGRMETCIDRGWTFTFTCKRFLEQEGGLGAKAIASEDLAAVSQTQQPGPSADQHGGLNAPAGSDQPHESGPQIRWSGYQ